MKRIIVFVIITVLACTAIGCANSAYTEPEVLDIPVNVTNEPADAPEAVDTPEPVKTEEPLADGEYTIEREIDGRRLILYGRQNDNGSFGITKFSIYDGDALVQTVETSDAIATEWTDEYRTEATETYAEDGGLMLADMNFDGETDIGLDGWITAGANMPAYYWLYDASTQQYDYAFCLTNAQPDAKKKQILCGSQNGADCYIVDAYEFDESGSLKLAKRTVEVENVDEDSADGLNTLLEQIDADYFPGTAGCSLTGARLCAELLDWYAVEYPDSNLIIAVSNRFYNALDSGEQTEFMSKLAELYSMMPDVMDESGADMLETAGYEPVMYPWDPSTGELVFSCIYAGTGVEMPIY